MKIRWRMMIAACASLAAGPLAAQGPLQGLSFLSGCWRGAVDGSTTIEESWTAADADLMLATTRYLNGGRVVGWEISRLEADSAGIRLTPYPDGVAAVTFPLDSIAPGRAVFANAANDFPQRIIYSGDGETALVVRLEGGGREIEWRMLPGACGLD